MANVTPNKQAIFELATELLQNPSISPNDAGCQPILISRLESLNFTVEQLRFGETDNFWAYLDAKQSGPTLMFSGHTDVVPVGNLEDWHTAPFTPTLIDDTLFARGAADMKGSIASMIIAVECFIKSGLHKKGRIAFLITSDEEDKATDGTQKVVEVLRSRNENIEYCIVGEPSSRELLGDVVKNGRRGSLTGTLKVIGVQGHVAYPHLAKNPVHKALIALAELTNEEWDQGNEYFPATTMQIANINAGTGSPNVIPGELIVQFNFRFSTELTVEQIKVRVTEIFDRHQLNYELDWWLSGLPFLTQDGELVEAVSNAITEHAGITPALETTGGTSDGRFIATLGTQVVELGPVNATIHKINESVSVNDLHTLSKIYKSVMEDVLG